MYFIKVQHGKKLRDKVQNDFPKYYVGLVLEVLRQTMLNN